MKKILSRVDEARLEEISLDKLSAKQTFRAAMSAHHNIMNSINKSEKELWDHIIETHGLDPSLGYSAIWNSLDRRYTVELKEVKLEYGSDS